MHFIIKTHRPSQHQEPRGRDEGDGNTDKPNANRGKKVCSFICSKLQCKCHLHKKKIAHLRVKKIRWERDADAVSLTRAQERSTNRTEQPAKQCTSNSEYRLKSYIDTIFREFMNGGKKETQTSHELTNLFYEMNDRYGICVQIFFMCPYDLAKLALFFVLKIFAKISQCSKGVVG